MKKNNKPATDIVESECFKRVFSALHKKWHIQYCTLDIVTSVIIMACIQNLWYWTELFLNPLKEVFASNFYIAVSVTITLHHTQHTTVTLTCCMTFLWVKYCDVQRLTSISTTWSCAVLYVSFWESVLTFTGLFNIHLIETYYL